MSSTYFCEPRIAAYVDNQYLTVRRCPIGYLSRASTVQPMQTDDRPLCRKACFELPGRQAVCKTSN